MKMIATEPAFYKGQRLRRGHTFEFDPAAGKAPRWPVPEGTPVPPLVVPEPGPLQGRRHVGGALVRENPLDWPTSADVSQFPHGSRL